MWFSAYCLIIAIALIFLWNDSKPPNNFPPGPPSVPLLGNYLLFKFLYRKLSYTHLVWEHFAGIYGKVVGLRMGKDRLVLVSGHEAVREMLTREEFDGRPDGFFFRLRSFGQRLGIVFIDGDFFNEQKRFCVKHLRSLGLGRNTMEDRIGAEVTELIGILRENCKEPITMPKALDISVLNILWTFVAGQRFNTGDNRPKELLKYIHTSFRLQDMSGGILNQLPFIRFIAPEISTYNKFMDVLNNLSSFIKELINEHQKTVSPGDSRDLIDAYLHEISNSKHEVNPSFSDQQLLMLLLDLLLVGSETTSSTLGFAILYLLHYPEVQKKLQLEMDSVVGRDSAPDIHSRARMMYMDAFLLEVQRHSNVTPTTVSHRAKCDTYLLGYKIPKDTMIIANLFSVHMDKDYWGDPEAFRPERFLDEKGNLLHEDRLIPFGLGKRRCIGESMARSSSFLFMAALLHNFSIKCVSGQPLPTLKGDDGATLSPVPFQCKLIPRG